MAQNDFLGQLIQQLLQGQQRQPQPEPQQSSMLGNLTGNAMNQMSGLGGMIGNQFGAAHANNQAAAQRQQDLAHQLTMLQQQIDAQKWQQGNANEFQSNE